MDSFWEVIADVDVEIRWLVELKNYLDKIEKEHAKTKRKNWHVFLEILILTE